LKIHPNYAIRNPKKEIQRKNKKLSNSRRGYIKTEPSKEKLMFKLLLFREILRKSHLTLTLTLPNYAIRNPEKEQVNEINK